MSDTTAVQQTSNEGSGTRRRRKLLLPLVLFLVWLAIGAIGGPYSGKLAEVQKNDNSAFLPVTAESQRASEMQKTFSDSKDFPAFVLVESKQALTPADLGTLGQFASGIPALSIPVEGASPVTIGDFLTPGPVPVLPSKDGKAALILLNFNADDVGATLSDGTSPILRSVEVIREQEDKVLPGAEVYVAGPGGQLADLVKAFEGLDGILLVVALLAVLVILLVVYRSPVIPFLVILNSLFALTLASVVIYFMAKHEVLTLDGQGQGILSILVVGAATDYALLLVARYREELRRFDDRFEAMRTAWKRTLEPVIASGGTVILGLLCLLLADLGPTAGLGPVGAVGIAAAVLASLTLLPAMLLLPGRTTGGEHGRWIFWPAVPHVGSAAPTESGLWGRVAALVGAHPRRVWVVTALAMLALAAFLPTFKAEGVKQSDIFLTKVESVDGGKALARHFPSGSGSPTVVIGPAETSRDLVEAIVAEDGVDSAEIMRVTPAGGPPRVVDGRVMVSVTLTDAADSPAADETVKQLRKDLDKVSTEALVGGVTATNLDVRTIARDDRNRVIPVILLVIFLVLALLLRSLVAPLVLIVANVISFAATLGLAAIFFNHVFHFPGGDPGTPLYGFVFLVALGIDYSIFLMTRVREETALQGTRPGILTGLSVTGGVITSAGIVLAATFAALGVLPLLFLAQIAFIVAVGVLLDTMVVRSLLVPALCYDLGSRIWRPSSLDKAASTE